MAAKKKTASKKVIEKINKGRIARGAKPIPVVKRPYNRKPKEESVNNTMSAEAVNAVGNGYAEATVLHSDELFKEFNHMPPMHLSEQILAVEALDMRALSVEDHFCVLAMLKNIGYLTSNGARFIDNPENLIVALSAELISFNHDNKLIDAHTWEDASKFRFISKPKVTAHVDVEFSYPESSTPNFIEVGNSLYRLVD